MARYRREFFRSLEVALVRSSFVLSIMCLHATLIAHAGIAQVFFIVVFAGDQLIRLYGSTADVTWRADFLTTQTVISLGLFAIAGLTAVFERLAAQTDQEPAPRGEISGWGAFALGGLLF